MFGSKLRSWMENHIVRPRKKGNKTKNANSGGASASNAAGCSHEAYKKPASAAYIIHHGNGSTTTTATTTVISSSVPGNSSSNFGHNHYTSNGNGNGHGSAGGSGSANGGNGGCSSVIASPVRRREVSPIQNHTQSRYGWQSPDQETITSPQSDNFLYAPQHRRVRATAHHLPHTAPVSKENSSEDKSSTQSHSQSYTQSHSHSQQQQQHLQQQQYHQQPLQQPPHPADCSSSSISSLSWSTGSKEPSAVPSSSNAQYSKRVPAIEIHAHTPPSTAVHMEFKTLPDEDPNAVHYEEICTILRHPDSFNSNHNHNNNNFMPLERPKSEQLTTFAPARNFYDEMSRHSQDDASTRYGRLLPSKMQPHGSSGSNDSLNANQLRSGSVEFLPHNNTNHSRQYHKPAHSYSSGASAGMPAYQGQHISTALVAHTHRTGRFRTSGGRQAFPGGGNGGGAMPTSCAGAPPLHSLSSPESAYSTGYSTDGTSPGAIYTPPEYYINMRTGTHYFPKSVNSLAIEAQRYKFGLNKIEEMSPIDPLPKTTFGNASSSHHSHTHMQGHTKIPNFCAPHANATSSLQQQLEDCEQQQVAHPQAPTVIGCHSPLALRNSIILPTLKGFESPSPRQRCRIRTNPWYSTMDTCSSGASATMAAMQSAFQPTACSPSTMSSSVSSTSACSSVMKMELDAASITSSGIKSSNENGHEHRNGKAAGGGMVAADGCNVDSNQKQQHNGITSYESSESSSSLTEVENMKRTYSPNTIKRKRSELLQRTATATGYGNGNGTEHHHQPVADMLIYAAVANVGCDAGAGAAAIAGGLTYQDMPLSDDDATLNEMMGKFDESYVYEKETDILSSDSDPTDCASDLDTGQDAGDECDTDELLDIDFIDTSSMQDVYDRKDSICYYSYSNNNSTTSPTRHQTRNPPIQVETRVLQRSRRSSRSLKTSHDQAPAGNSSAGSHVRRKRFLKTRKKSAENRDERQFAHNSPVRRSRESRSVGGTPVSLRKNHAAEKKRIYKTSPLSNRASSLIFTNDVREQRSMTIAESERALLRADLEADVKYRQLILEAESILVSMKSSMQSIPRETPVASPRRLNPLANKRVEMLKNCEVEPKREQQKQQRNSLDALSQAEQELAAAIHKRIELLKYESASAPNSPKASRCSPRKTHVTNFINQNIPPEVPLRKSQEPAHANRPQSPQLQLNGRRLPNSPTASPSSRRRFRSHSPRIASTPTPTPTYTAPTMHGGQGGIAYDSDSEQEEFSRRSRPSSRESIRCVNFKHSAEDMANCNYLPEIAKIMLYAEADAKNRNIAALGSYCPQSEPLKRKVYKGSSTFERIKKSFDLESELPKQALLAKINLMRRERQSSAAKLSSSPRSSSQDLNQQQQQQQQQQGTHVIIQPHTRTHSNASMGKVGCEARDEDTNHASNNNHNSCNNNNNNNNNNKKQLILNTIADLKRSLENQSVELNGLNGED